MKTTFRTIQNATVAVDNHDDENRRYNLGANAHIQSGKVEALYDGAVSAADETGSPLGSFSSYPDRSLNLNFTPEVAPADRFAILEAVTDFCQDACNPDSELTVTCAAN